MAMTRQTFTNDAGDRTSGTLLNAAFFTSLLDNIEINWLTDSYTPALTGSGTNPAPSSSTGAYMRFGKLYIFRANFTMSATLGTGSYSVSLPATATTGVGLIVAFAQDVSAGGAIYNGKGFISGATPTKCDLFTDDALLATGWGPGANLPIPATGFGSGDPIHVFGVYFGA